MRHFKTTIIAVVCLAIAIISIFAVKMFLPENSETEESTPNEDTSVYLFSKDNRLKATKIEAKNEEFFSLYFADDRWNIASHTDLKVYDSAVDTFVNSFFGLKGNIIKDFDNLSDFGLGGEDALYTSVSLEDGTVFKIYFGITDNTGNARFVMIDGVEDTVYRISSNSANSVMMTRGQLVSLYAMSFSSGYNPAYFFIDKDGKTLLQAKGNFKAATTESEKDLLTWSITEPLDVSANNEEMTKLVNSLRNITLTGMHDDKCEDLSVYGLDVPVVVYTLICENDSGKQETRSISIGNKTEDSTGYYCIIDGDDSYVYTVPNSMIMVDIALENFIDGKPFYEMYTELSTVNLTYRGATHTMKFVFGENNSEERFFDGVYVHPEDQYEDANANTPEDKFNRLLSSMYMLSITTVDTEEPAEKGELLFKVEYNLINGSKVTVECFERDDRTVYLYKDGEYFGGYMETAVRLEGSFDDFGVKGSLDALLEVMK